MSSDADSGKRVDPLDRRPGDDQGDTAVPKEGDIAQAPQTVDADFTPQED
ncbi:MAG TPA: hypothetical protein VGD01_09920 [Candidatus Elarobacter sp.]|jgi:hypothetical protein